MAGRLGIVAGCGGLPRHLVECCRTAGRDVFVLALEGAAEPTTVEGVPHAWCRLGRSFQSEDEDIAPRGAAGFDEVAWQPTASSDDPQSTRHSLP